MQRSRKRETEKERKREGREIRKRWEVEKAHLPKGNVANVHRRCS